MQYHSFVFFTNTKFDIYFYSSINKCNILYFRHKIVCFSTFAKTKLLLVTVLFLNEFML